LKQSETRAVERQEEGRAEMTQSETGLWTVSKKEGAEVTQSETRAVDRK
jgi:hypothetical protein